MASACRHCGQPHEAYVTVCPVTGGRLGSATYTLVNDDELLVGSVVGERHHLRDILGQGSTGTVFGTVHAHFEREAAMKVLRPRHVSLDTVQRAFHSDARAAFSVAHPSLVEVFDIGMLPDGAPFFVMERLAGDTLAARLGRERFSVAAAVDLMMQLLSAMEALHAREILVRDLRPQNVFLTQRRGCRPVLKLLDVGLWRMTPLERVQAQWDTLRAVVGANESTGLLSIPYYLSPERTRGEQGLEPSSDIFVAAAIFYEALTGQKAFQASTWSALLAQIAQGQPTPLSVLRPDVPEDLGALVMRALSSHPRARPASAPEMQDELRAVFEAPKRGAAAASASMRSAPSQPAEPVAPPAPMASPAAPQPLAAQASAAIDHLYEEQTNADSRFVDVTVAARVNALIDEASADHPIRTLRPPSADVEIHIDVEHDDPAATSRGEDLSALLGASGALSSSARRTDEDDETETMQLTPEVRARIEQMTKAAAERSASIDTIEDSNRPPPTRRLSKPPR